MRTATILSALLLFSAAVAAAFSVEEKWSTTGCEWNNGAPVMGSAATEGKYYTIDEGFLREWDVRSGKPTAYFKLSRPDAAPALSADGTRLAVSAGMKLMLFSVPGLRKTGEHTFDRDVAGAIAFAGGEIVVGTKGGAIWKGGMEERGSWRRAEGEFEWHGIITDVVVSSDGRIAVCGGDRLRVFDSSLKLLWEKEITGGGLIGCFFVKTDAGNWLVAASYAQTFFFEADTGDERNALKNEGGMVGAAAAPWGFVAVYRNGRVTAFDLTEQIMRQKSWTYGEPLYSPAVAGDRILAFTSGGRCVVFDRDGDILNGKAAAPPAVLSLASGPNKGKGRWVAAGSAKGIAVYDAEDGSPLTAGKEYEGAVLRLLPAGEGRMLALYHTRTVRLFEVATGETLASLTLDVFPTAAACTHEGIVVCSAPARAVFFSPHPPEGEERKVEKIEGLPRYRYWALNSDGTMALAETKGHEVTAVKIADGSAVRMGAHVREGGRFEALRDVALMGATAATVSAGTLIFWSLSRLAPASPPIELSEGDMPEAVALLDEKTAAVLFADGKVKVMDAEGTLLAETEPGRPATCIAACEGGFVVGYRDGGIVFFRTAE